MNIRSLQKKGKTIFEDFASVCKKKSIYLWPDYGSLLGLFRKSTFLPNDADLDIGVFCDNRTVHDLFDLIDKHGYTLKEVYEDVLTNKIYKIKIERKLVLLDLSLFYEEENKSDKYIATLLQVGSTWFLRKVPNGFIFPLDRKLFLNQEIFWPSSANEVLALHYGPSFMEPDSNWHDSKSGDIYPCEVDIKIHRKKIFRNLSIPGTQ